MDISHSLRHSEVGSSRRAEALRFQDFDREQVSPFQVGCFEPSGFSTGQAVVSWIPYERLPVALIEFDPGVSSVAAKFD